MKNDWFDIFPEPVKFLVSASAFDVNYYEKQPCTQGSIYTLFFSKPIQVTPYFFQTNNSLIIHLFFLGINI